MRTMHISVAFKPRHIDQVKVKDQTLSNHTRRSQDRIRRETWKLNAEELLNGKRGHYEHKSKMRISKIAKRLNHPFFLLNKCLGILICKYAMCVTIKILYLLKYWSNIAIK